MKLVSKSKKIRLFLSLRTRFILLISIILLLIFGLITYFLVDYSRNTLTANLNNEVQAFSSLSAQPIGDTFVTYQQSGSILISQQMQKFAALDKNISNIAVVNLSGKTLFSLNNNSVNISADEASNFMSSTHTNSHKQITQIVQPYFDNNSVHSYAVVYTISTQSVERSIVHGEYITILFTALGLVVSAVATYLFLDNLFLRPIENVSDSSQLIAAGNYDHQIQYKRSDEIGALASSVNKMANALKADISKLQEVDNLKTEFITLASHNLRTPLTIIRGYIDLLKSGQTGANQPDENIAKAIGAIDTSAKNLNIFSEQMLTIASISSNPKSSLFKETSLQELLEPLAAEYALIAKEKQIEFNFRVDDDSIKVMINQEQLTKAVRNLLINAIEFTKSGGIVTLLGGKDELFALIKVIDSGIGIDSSEIPKLFTKFHRASGELLTNSNAGTGLGLYVTKLIVEEHGGSISAESEVGKGSTFTIKLPELDLTPVKE